MPYAVTGNADQIAELLCGPRQHDDHTKGWRWHLYMQDAKKRHDAMLDGAREIIARTRREEFQQAAE